MTVLRVLLLCGWVVGGLPAVCFGQGNGGGLETRILRGLSSELKWMERRMGEITEELKPLPVLQERVFGSRFGHHSGPLKSETEDSWVHYDLKGLYAVDTIVLMPVYLSYQGKQGEGYGFPKRFKVEVADNPEMKNAVTVVDCSRVDVVNPGRFPLTWKFTPLMARYVKFTSLKHAREGDEYFWALEEMMVLSGEMNVAISCHKTASSQLDLFPQWALVRLSDGQSALGMPVDMASPSPTNGYLSANVFDEVSQKWVSVDLGTPQVIEQVQLLPLESDAYEVVGGRGFPRKFWLEIASDPGFEQIVWSDPFGGYALGYPAGCALSLRVPNVTGRYVRISTEALWKRDDFFCFGLAEFQVYAGGKNVALGKPVAAMDRADKPADAGWAPEYLVDGYTTRYRWIGWPEYLELIERRRQLESEQVVLRSAYTEKLAHGRALLLSAGGGVLLALLIAWVWAVLRGRLLRRREVTVLRDQIARDLHDDIGSNLGGIVLLSEIGSQYCKDPDARRDFETIRDAAQQASISMRDIVWLVQREKVGLKDLVRRMREAEDIILRHVEVDFSVDPPLFAERSLSLLFRRHMFFAYKEVLNNIRKHAGASRVSIEVEIGNKQLRFRVSDNGVGFDPEAVLGEGCGMDNLKRRASRLSGDVSIESKPKQGTVVTFEAPFTP